MSKPHNAFSVNCSTQYSSYPTGIVKAAYTWGANGLVSERLVNQSKSLWYAVGPQGETRQLTDSTGAVTYGNESLDRLTGDNQTA